jgi:hypothetical protein
LQAGSTSQNRGESGLVAFIKVTDARLPCKRWQASLSGSTYRAKTPRPRRIFLFIYPGAFAVFARKHFFWNPEFPRQERKHAKRRTGARRSWADVKGTKKDSSLYSENPSSLREIAA